MDASLTDMLTGTVEKNVGMTERRISGICGAVMTLAGLSRKSVGGLLTALGGAYLLYRGLKGHCFVYDLLGINSAAKTTLRSPNEPPPPSVERGDEVTESSWESFPTSDPPSWTMGRERKS